MRDFEDYEYLRTGNKVQRKSYEILSELDIKTALKHYSPVLVGTIPIGINIESSDLDILCEVNNFEEFDNIILEKYGHFSEFTFRKKTHQNRISYIYNFIFNDVEIEIFAQNKAVKIQNGYKHMVIENVINKVFGDVFVDEIIHLKRLGLKTEFAYAELLDLYGNPFEAILAVDNIANYNWNNSFKELDFYDDIIDIHRFSYDKKSDRRYKIKTAKKDYLVRLSDLNKYQVLKAEFENIKHLYDLDILVPKPCKLHKENNVVLVYEWLEGDYLEGILEVLPLEDQYNLGYEAGKILRKIHSIKGKSYDWSKKYEKALEKTIEDYISYGVKHKKSFNIIEFINSNKDVLNSYSISYLHGDFCLKNIILDSNKELGLVNFEKSFYGDSLKDFYEFSLISNISTSFAIGQIRGYLGNNIPKDFFKKVAVYTALFLLESLTVASKENQENVDLIISDVNETLFQYDNFKDVVPKWFIKNI